MIYQLFVNQCKATPSSMAIITSQDREYTYSEASARVNQWANFLLENGIQSGDRVAALLSNEDNHVFIFLALDRINAIYVPFDTDSITLQLAQDLTTLNIKKMLIDTVIEADFNIDPAIILSLTDDALSNIIRLDTQAPTCAYNNRVEKISYLVSSSGTTTAKKWIPILGAGLTYWADIIKTVMHFKAEDKILATRSPAYDARIFEYVCAFSVGAELHLLNTTQRKDLSSILSACQQASITGLLLIASQLEGKSGKSIIASLPDLKHLMVTGDACTPHLKTWCENKKIDLWNAYGPTEATFGLSIIRVNGINIKNATGQPLVPIGKPYGNDVRHHIIDDKLYIESPYLSPGYIDAEKGDSLFSKKTINGKKIRLFDTGDRFYEKDGYLFYEGRHGLNSHCKVNGVKVTSFAIEQCINEYIQKYPTAGIHAVAVVIKQYMGKNKPVAYIVMDTSVDKTALVAYLKTHLQKEAFPLIKPINELPLLAISGKIDRRQLVEKKDDVNACDATQRKQTDIYTSPHHVIVQRIWCELFQQDNIDNDMEFERLGGDSMMLSEMIILIRQQIYKEYSLAHLLDEKKITINTVCATINQVKINPSEQAFIHQLTTNESNRGNVFLLPPLLGEGHFTYRHLAPRLEQRFNKNIYGLTEPGTVDQALLSKNLKYAARRYMSAIKTIQNTGSYTIMGFSFGSTLAFAVAELLEKKGASCEVHLLDGRPPQFYQMLANNDFTQVLQETLDFISGILNDHFLENLPPIVLKDHPKRGKQISLGFAKIEEKLRHDRSKLTLNVAKTHFIFMVTTYKPQRPLNTKAILYVTRSTQKHFDIIYRTVNCQYFFWNHYFSNITRCGKTLDENHLDVISDATKLKLDRHSYTPSPKIAPLHLTTSNFFNFDRYNLKPFYRFDVQDSGSFQLSLFFLENTRVDHFINSLIQIGLAPKLTQHKSNLSRAKRGDTQCLTHHSLFCKKITHQSREKIEAIMFTSNIPKRESAAHQLRSQNVGGGKKQKGVISLNIVWFKTHLLTLSLNYCSPKDTVMDMLEKDFQLKPRSDFNIRNNIPYEYNIEYCTENLHKTFENINSFLADFITALQTHTAKDVCHNCPHPTK